MLAAALPALTAASDQAMAPNAASPGMLANSAEADALLEAMRAAVRHRTGLFEFKTTCIPIMIYTTR